MTIKFKVNPNLNWERLPEFLMQICFLNGTPTYDEKKGKWILGGSNDWWLRRTGEHEYELSYRYAGGRIEEMNALRTVILWRLGIQHFNGGEEASWVRLQQSA